MDFREMLYITTVADCRSITAAARKLYISQPSLSHIVSKVEQDVGVKLFDRGTSPLTITYAGEKYVETARKILLMSDNLRKELIDAGLGEKGRINFGMPTERAGYMLPAVIPEFKKQYPGIELQVMEAKSDELLQAILRDDISFYVIPRSQGELPVGLKAESIYREQLLLVAEGSMLTEDMFLDESSVLNMTEGKRKNRCVNLSKMANLPFVMLKKGHAIRKKTDLVLRQYGIDPKIMIELSSCISAVQLAAAGLGVAIVPQRAIDALGGMERFNCYDFSVTPEFWSVNAVYKEDMYLGRAERFLIDLMKQKFNL
ncbi:LysR family transcriptional regulator [Clostridium sp. AM42-4]|uniref:LysR family transcriptional regulator n=1 Tax=Clostridium sp. AM42-4 TaxID=2292305 RepID=UPI000E4F8CBC|nr:LysR family transcriptional regulator [Clostridium sp. AM42-4]RHS90259.1 LysR family transcriptional regulator [Clostridium sp. AM42-4]HBM47289.1 LysR family transcriptional regulator [Lachnoclostridium sp.]